MNKNCTCDLHDNIDESVKDFRLWGKYDSYANPKWEVWVLGVSLLFIVLVMIFVDVPVTVN